MVDASKSDIKILWIGYGKMGRPMCRLVAERAEVEVFEPAEARRVLARQDGLQIAESGISNASAADVIVTSLPDDAAALAVFTHANGVLRGVERGTLLIETSTISPAASVAIADSCENAGALYVRAPVSGTVDAAVEAKLTSFISGKDAAIQRAEPVIGCYSSRIIRVGDAEQARIMKLAVNLMVNTLAVSLAEALALCRKGGLELSTSLEAITGSAVGSPLLLAKARRVLEQDFTPDFMVRQTRKDLRLLTTAADGLSVPLPLGSTVAQIFAATEANGMGEEDYIACTKLLSSWAGLD